MSYYKALKDFPTMRAAKEYKKGDVIELAENSRTNSLLNLGYIEKYTRKTTRNCSDRADEVHVVLSRALSSIDGLKSLSVDEGLEEGRVYFSGYVDTEDE